MPDADGLLEFETDVNRGGGSATVDDDGMVVTDEYDSTRTHHPFVGFGNYRDFLIADTNTVDHYDSSGHLIWSDNR